MNIRISTVNVRYGSAGVDGATVHFTGRDDREYVNVSGSMPLTADEYNGNEAPDKLTGVIRAKIAEMMESDETAGTTEGTTA